MHSALGGHQNTIQMGKVNKLSNQMAALQERPGETERYSRWWNLCLLNLLESSNKDVRKDVLEIITQIVTEEEKNMD